MGVRFAPSPTGSFHIGNLRTAWISYWWARALKKPWIVRFEDIDKPRELRGAQEEQLADMKQLGLVPDEVIVQSERFDRHFALFEKIKKEGLAYPCYCSRKEVLDGLASAPHGAGSPYTGKCRTLMVAPEVHKPSIAWRLKMPDPSGTQDFIIARTDRDLKRDFVPAYQWACGIDDGDGDYDLLVRAVDLQDSARPQRAVQQWMGKTKFPAVFHTSLVLGNDQSRLEKRTKGITLHELLDSGLTIDAILEKFRLSFKGEADDFRPEKIFAEDSQTLTLADLGL